MSLSKVNHGKVMIWTKEGCCYTKLPLGRNEGPKSLESYLALKMQLSRGSLTDVEQHAALEIQ